MAFKLNKVFDPLTKMVTGKGSKSGAKKTYRYQVRFKGAQVSKHFTKKAADLAARKISGARVSKLTAGSKKRY